MWKWITREEFAEYQAFRERREAEIYRTMSEFATREFFVSSAHSFGVPVSPPSVPADVHEVLRMLLRHFDLRIEHTHTSTKLVKNT